MGKMQDFLGWLSGEDGGGGSKGSFSSSRGGRKGTDAAQVRSRKMLFKLRLQIKRMQSQQRKLEFQADKTKKKAVEMRRNGDEQGARMYAAEMLKYRKMSGNMVKFVTNLQAMQFKLEAVAETQKMAHMFESIDASLQDLKGTVSVPELQSTLESINSTIMDMDANLEITQEGLELTTEANVKVSDKELKGALDEIDQSIAVEGLELPGAADTELTPEEGEKINDYKSRIDSLKG
ncbi:MAG: Snf7 family protein [Candidatus Lokiarchaeota archaeon]|nr:Snf7 family protein [Candidatus Lokiarchaeota archaeon]